MEKSKEVEDILNLFSGKTMDSVPRKTDTVEDSIRKMNQMIANRKENND